MDQSTSLTGHDGTMPDAAMMDQNIDDLFGEAADGLAVDALGVALPSAPLLPSVVLRMMEKQTTGCCTKLAWSNAGSIAQITDRGRKIEFRTMLRHPKTGHWDMTEPSDTPVVAPEGRTFQHIQFSGVGTNMAVADDRGSVHVRYIVGPLGKMPLAVPSIGQFETAGGDLDVVVGLHWLPLWPAEFKTPYITPATKIGEKWMTEMRNRNTNDQVLHHPSDGRHSLFYVSRNSKLTLLYQDEQMWSTTSIEVDKPGSTADLLSHAAMTEHGDHLLLVTYDEGLRFRLYKITVDWHPTQHTRPVGPPYTTVAPTLEISRLTMLEHITAQQADLAVLSDLRLIPPIPFNVAESESPASPTVLAIFTRAALPADPAQQHPEAFSIIARWQVESVQPVLHESFTKLKPNSNVPTQSSTTILRRQEDIITSKLVLSSDSLYHNTTLAFCASDGTIEFRDRLTMTTLEPYGDTTTVSSLPQAGFEHLMDDHHAHVAMSPDGSALAITKHDNTLNYKLMALRYSWQPLEDGISDTHELIEAAVICLARQYAILCCCTAANDDILTLLPPDLSDDLRALFIKEICKMTNRTVDIALMDPKQQQMFTLKETLIRSVFSAQYAIARKQGTMEPTWASKFAFAFLSLRQTGTSLAQAMHRQEPLAQAITLHTLRGVLKWSCDFLVYFVDSLITLKRAIKTKNDETSTAQAFINAAIARESPVVNLVVCSFTRAFIRFLGQTIAQSLSIVSKVIPHARSLNQRQELEDIFSYAMNIPFKLPALGSLITDIDALVRSNYNSNSIPPDRRAEIELDAMTSPHISKELMPVIQSLVDTVLPKFIESVDQAALYFRDTTWLGIEPRPPGEVEYDIVRKLPMPKNARVRVCRRCGSVMEDIGPERMREGPPWLAHASRHCVCGGYWILRGEGAGESR